MAWLKGALSAAFIAINTIGVCVPLYFAALVRLFLIGGWRRAVTRRMDLAIDVWVSANRGLLRALNLVDLEVAWPSAPLRRNQWYLVVSNHQTWADILLLQTTLRPVLPPLKFFTKRQLIWLPLAGLAMKLLGFPYVRRGRPSAMHANRAEVAAKDREATMAACAVFRNHPTAVLSFLEGTRFTSAKHEAQESRFRHLLNPKIGGLSYVLSGLQEQLHQLVDVTIHYPDGVPGFWAFLQGRRRRVRMWVEVQDLRLEMRTQDPTAQRAALGPFIEELWRAKDARLHAAKSGWQPERPASGSAASGAFPIGDRVKSARRPAPLASV